MFESGPDGSGGRIVVFFIPTAWLELFWRIFTIMVEEDTFEEDPVLTNPDHYSTIFENDFVRVLEYIDDPGESTTPHVHPNSVMVTLSDFQRRLSTGAGDRDVNLPAHQVLWLPAQRHSGENIGKTETHTILIELKGEAAGIVDDTVIGPVT